MMGYANEVVGGAQLMVYANEVVGGAQLSYICKWSGSIWAPPTTKLLQSYKPQCYVQDLVFEPLPPLSYKP